MADDNDNNDLVKTEDSEEITSKNEDISDEANTNLQTEKDESGFVKSFPQRLQELLSVEDDTHQQCISWTPSGDAFSIINEQKFVDNVLPRYFKRTKFASFKGKLYRWGFRRVNKGINAGAYFHKLFLKDDPSLCLHMRRQLNKTQRKENAKVSTTTPTATDTTTINDGHNNIMPPNNLMPMMPFTPNNPISNPAFSNSAFMSSKQSSQALLNAQAYARKHMHMMICSNFNNFPASSLMGVPPPPQPLMMQQQAYNPQAVGDHVIQDQLTNNFTLKEDDEEKSNFYKDSRSFQSIITNSGNTTANIKGVMK